MTGMSHAFLSGYSRVRGCRIPRSGDTQRGKNVAYFFSDRSRGRESRIPRSGDTQGVRMSHAFFRTAQGRLPKLTSSKGKTTFFFGSYKMRSGVLFFINLKVWLWFSSEVTWMAISWIVNTEPGFIGSRWIREE